MSGRAVFWDFDGTLCMPSLPWARSAHRALCEHGQALTLDELVAFSVSGVYSWHRPERAYRPGVWWDELFAEHSAFYRSRGVPEELHPSIHRRFRELVLGTPHKLYPDAVEALEETRARGWDNYLLSNNYPELEALVHALGIGAYFQAMIVSGVVGYEKPHPALFAHALALAGNPAVAYMVGDNPVADVEGGRAAGMRTVLVRCGDSHCGADYLLPDLRGFADILA